MIHIPEEIALEHLRSFYRKGDVLFWENFPGKEKSKDSYFVLLTDCVNDKFLMARTTSRTYYYFNGPLAKRIEHDIVFIKNGETQLFAKDTIIDLTSFRWFSVNQLAKLLGESLKKKGQLSKKLIERINQCVKQSVTISERDIKTILKF